MATPVEPSRKPSPLRVVGADWACCDVVIGCLLSSQGLGVELATLNAAHEAVPLVFGEAQDRTRSLVLGVTNADEPVDVATSTQPPVSLIVLFRQTALLQSGLIALPSLCRTSLCRTFSVQTGPVTSGTPRLGRIECLTPQPIEEAGVRLHVASCGHVHVRRPGLQQCNGRARAFAELVQHERRHGERRRALTDGNTCSVTAGSSARSSRCSTWPTITLRGPGQRVSARASRTTTYAGASSTSSSSWRRIRRDAIESGFGQPPARATPSRSRTTGADPEPHWSGTAGSGQPASPPPPPRPGDEEYRPLGRSTRHRARRPPP